jgi:hypothetical protein
MSATDVVDGLAPPSFCAGGVSNYVIGGVTPFTVPITLIAGTDWLSVDFPAGTDLSSVVFGGVSIDGNPLLAASQLVIVGEHLKARIPVAAGNLLAGTTHWMQVDGVINTPTAGTYCLYIDYEESCAGGGCVAVQFACVAYTVAPAVLDLGCHFDFGPTYTGIAEDYIPAFKACGIPGFGTFVGGVGDVTDFNFILRDENGGCSDPCTTPSQFWFEVTKCPAGATIYFDEFSGGPYTLTDADITTPPTKYSLMPLFAWPPPDVTLPMQIHFDTPGEYELKFFVECPAGGCPLCGGPTIITECTLAAKVYQFMDAYKVPLEEKWNLVSLPLFPFDTSIESVLGSMDDITQLVSVWYFGQCEDPAPDAGIWHTEAYDAVAGTFTGDVDTIQTGKAYWLRMLHLGETGFNPASFPQGFWVFGTHAIMPDPAGVDMGYFNVCEGWNMVGFKPPWVPGAPPVPIAELDGFAGVGYLWNFNLLLGHQVNYGVIYDWQPGAVQDWLWWLPGTLMMQPGEGYWIPFDGDSEIYPKP